jgi:hypothetical protein
MTKRAIVITAALLCSLPALATLAQQKAPPAAAIVEDVDGKVKGVELFEYVETGRAIDTAGGTVVLNYLASCTRETVTGGKLVIGDKESSVTGGQVQRSTVTCDGGKLVLADAQSGKSGAQVFRAGPQKREGRATLPKPHIIIYGTSPVITLSQPADAVLIERLDVSGAIVTLRPVKGKTDMAAEGKRLEPGGLYKATAGGVEVVFLVDTGAKPGKEPLVARLLRL